MSLWSLLGGEINYERVNKNNLKIKYKVMDSIIFSILFADKDEKMENIISKETESLIGMYNSLSKQDVINEYKRLLKKMGNEAPTKERYPAFESVLWETWVPSQRKLKKNPHWQENWSRAYKWFKEQEIPEDTKILQQKIKELEERIQKLEQQNNKQ